MNSPDDDRPGMALEAIDVGAEAPEGFRPVGLATSRGEVKCRFYQVAGAGSAVIWIGGVGGDWDTPAQGLYPRLCRELQDEGIASLRVQFRHPTTLDESVADVLVGLAFLQTEGILVAGIIGHSFGGAVAIQAAVASEAVRSVVTLATQSSGADPVARLAPRCPILIVHGTADRVLPPSCSEQVYAIAGGRKRLELIEGAGHGLDEAAGEVHRLVRDWIIATLGAIPSQPIPP
jgi:pimeloyl-ACP methyl ester carboxylesterase